MGGGDTPPVVDGLTDTSQRKKRQKQHHTGGIFSNADKIKVGRTGGTWAAKYGTKVAQWDIAPDELAWTSLNENAGFYECGSNGAEDGTRIHPTQKPIELYKWILHKYAKKGDRILDTHLGSGSSRIAAYEMGFDFTGCEKDSDYFLLQEKRFSEWTKQQSLFEFDGGEPVLF